MVLLELPFWLVFSFLPETKYMKKQYFSTPTHPPTHPHQYIQCATNTAAPAAVLLLVGRWDMRILSALRIPGGNAGMHTGSVLSKVKSWCNWYFSCKNQRAQSILPSDFDCPKKIPLVVIPTWCCAYNLAFSCRCWQLAQARRPLSYSAPRTNCAFNSGKINQKAAGILERVE